MKQPIMHAKTIWKILLAFVIITSLSCQAVNQLVPTAPVTPAGSTPIPPDVSAPTEAATAPPDQPTQADTPAPAKVIPTAPPNVYARAFADYPIIEVKLPQTRFTGYTLPVNLGSVQGLDTVKISAAQQALLSQNGFVVAAPQPGKYREFYQVYEYFRYAEVTPLFITTDSLFHVYHLVFDKMLRDLERDAFMQDLKVLTHTMLAASLQQQQQVAGTPLEDHARRNAAYFAVAAQLLGLPDPVPADAAGMVNAELKLIRDHAGAAVSPIWLRADLPEDQKLIEDYGQYVPRGHYTRSEDLKKYFMAMMWYGRLTFRLRDAFETQRALLATQAIRTAKAPDGASAEQLWQMIYDPTVFIVGKSDDLSFHEYGVLSDAVFGPGAAPTAFGDAALTAAFLEAAKNLPGPQVNSMWVWIHEDKKEATQGFRLMGQRFTLDEYVFGQLIWRKVGTDQKPRWLPKGLDFFAALGSDEAVTILNESGETLYDNYNIQMQRVQAQVGSLKQDSWTQNLYWSWLYAFQPMLAPKGENYPEFMRTKAWQRRDLNTVLGSWTELKHDTILYAKQVMAEMGGGGGPDVLPKGYVEPAPQVYARMLALTQMTADGLTQRGILSPVTKGNLDNLLSILKFCQSAAERELAGQPLTDKEYERIRYMGGEFEALTLASSDREGTTADYHDLSDQKSALVADIATGMGADGQLAAQTEATGQPTEMFVILPDKPWRIAVGAVFTYYEFSVPSSARLNDEQWQAKVEKGDIPAQPDWQVLFVAP